MKIKFCGADREVTGSCHLLEVEGKKVLVDCGLYQGRGFNENKNFDPFLFNPKEISAVLVTHGHVDHIGRIPKLVKDGFGGKIYMTKATQEIARLIWEDAHSIMSYNHKKFNEPVLFDMADIGKALSQCHGVDYGEVVNVFPEVKAVWKDAGHIFGSAFIEVEGEGKRVGFSGDVGNENVPILKDTNQLGELDALVCESTYGDRIHEGVDVRRSIILKLIKEGVAKGGTIMVPAFSLERTQEFLYELNMLREHGNELPQFPIFLDSPLAIGMVKIFKDYPDYYDEAAAKLHMEGDDFLDFPGFQMTYNKEASKSINHIRGTKMVIAGAGMMNGGRILHHALRYLSDPKSTLLIVGYQANGTLGRRLYEGAKEVTIFGGKVKVNCTVKAIGALSAHADQKKLVRWIGEAKKMPKEVFCVHGEPNAVTELAHKIKEVHKGVKTYVPEEGGEFEIN